MKNKFMIRAPRQEEAEAVYQLVIACDIEALARMNEDTLYVNQIGVRRSYRGRGLGLALLRQVLHTSYAAGQPIISLGVDAANLSGAYRLYEKVGMRAIHETTLCEKTIHA
jgi:ribosomal protein S18 acetylase RimI-like enzyme